MTTSPFVDQSYGEATVICDVESRLLRVKSFTAEECRAALEDESVPLQKTVRLAIERRLRVLAKEAVK